MARRKEIEKKNRKTIRKGVQQSRDSLLIRLAASRWTKMDAIG